MAPQNPQEYMARLATKNEAENDAIYCEPRIYYDTFAFDGATEVVSAHPGVFRNGERFPLRITHLAAQILYRTPDEENPFLGDERWIQRYGLRVRAHGTYYQNPAYTPFPLMSNVPVAASDVATQSTACWRFNKPVVLGNRDTFQVQVDWTIAPAEDGDRITVSFDGVGLYSRQPKKLVGYVEFDLTLATPRTINVDYFRNDGTEPLEVSMVTVNAAPAVTQTNPVGNVRNVRIRIRQNGSGTNQWWGLGPVSQTPAPTYDLQTVPAGLMGVQTGRAVLHKLPGDGWLWQPNEQIEPEVMAFDPTMTESVVFAVIGHIIVLK